MNKDELDKLAIIQGVLEKLSVSIPVIARQSFREGVSLARDNNLVGLDCYALFEMSETQKELRDNE